ncbi:MAG: hypothetical protein C5B47_06710 [Verrucomicrobia bacterium]|nr:MAG: hypothetical protein C5B47_06710 [Verrucomicrobiota bacterium]
MEQDLSTPKRRKRWRSRLEAVEIKSMMDTALKRGIREMEQSGVDFLNDEVDHTNIAGCAIRLKNASDALEILQRHKLELINFAQDLKKAPRSITTPLHLAARDGQLDVVKYLIDDLCFDVNERNKNGYTPIHQAAYNRDNEILSYLCAQHGANVNSEDYNGWVPLHLVCMQNTIAKNSNNFSAGFQDTENVIEKIMILYTHGANLEAATTEGAKPIHFAAEALGGLGLLKILVLFGANPEAKDSNNNTVYHYVVRGGRADAGKTIEGLIKLGIKNAHHKNNNGETPRDIAQRASPKLVPLLEYAEKIERIR